MLTGLEIKLIVEDNGKKMVELRESSIIEIITCGYYNTLFET